MASFSTSLARWYTRAMLLRLSSRACLLVAIQSLGRARRVPLTGLTG